MAASTYYKNQQLNWFKGTNWASAPATDLYFSIHDAQPDGVGSSEMVGAVSGRATYSVSNFSAPATDGNYRQIKNTALINWGTALTTDAATHWGLWDSASGGNFLFWGELSYLGSPSSLSFNTGDPVTLGIDSVAIRLDILSWSIYARDLQLNWFRGTNHPAALAQVYVGLSNTIVAAGTGTEITPTIAAARLPILSSEWGTITSSGLTRRMKNTSLLNYGGSLGASSPINNLSIWDSLTSGNLLLFPALTYPQSVQAGKPIYIPAGAISVAVA